MTNRPLLALLTAALTGCPSPTPPEPTTCEADPAWITSPSMPSEVPESESFCDFYQFSWQWFLAQVSPDPQNGEPTFTQNRVYVPTGGDNQCADTPVTGVLGAVQQLIPRQGKSDAFEDIQADGFALYDQGGNVLHYNAFYSQELCDSTPEGFAPGTLEVKASWMILPEGSHHTYYTITAKPPGYEEEISLGLVGLHLAIWTPNHPEMIWASWEHKTNAPLCNGTSAASGWSLASDDAAACLVANPTDGVGPSPACDSFAFNTPTPFSGGSVPLTSDPINVCRMYDHGNEGGTAVNGNDNAANLAAIEELNTALVGANGLLTALPSDSPMQVWSNYEMVGGLWTKDGANSGTPPVPSQQGPANASSPQRGSLELTNMTLETFQQGEQSYIPNCFGCHNYDSTKPLDVSHIQSKLLVAE